MIKFNSPIWSKASHRTFGLEDPLPTNFLKCSMCRKEGACCFTILGRLIRWRDLNIKVLNVCVHLHCDGSCHYLLMMVLYFIRVCIVQMKIFHEVTCKFTQGTQALVIWYCLTRWTFPISSAGSPHTSGFIYWKEWIESSPKTLMTLVLTKI